MRLCHAITGPCGLGHAVVGGTVAEPTMLNRASDGGWFVVVGSERICDGKGHMGKCAFVVVDDGDVTCM